MRYLRPSPRRAGCHRVFEPSAGRVWLAWVVVPWCVGLACCSANERVAEVDCSALASVDAVEVDGASSDALGVSDVGGSDVESSDSGAISMSLDPCLAACDRAVDCAVTACQGYSWASSGGLYVDCVTSCGANPLTIDSTSSCEAASAALSAAVPGFTALCASNPCQQACAKLSGCVVSECDKIQAVTGPQIEAGCLKDCTPQTSTWVNSGVTCKEMIAAIASNDPAFDDSCNGDSATPRTCAKPAVCAPYGKKLAGCLVQHCSAAAKPYQSGLEKALAAYCSGDAKCPPPAQVAAIVGTSTTCASPGLATFGKAAPFKRICDGTVGATAAEITTACTELMKCPNTGWLVSPEICLVVFGMRDDAATRVPCLNAAKDCAGRAACLKGF